MNLNYHALHKHMHNCTYFSDNNAHRDGDDETDNTIVFALHDALTQTDLQTHTTIKRRRL